jgi:DNA polymerase III subunit beta
MKFSVSQQSLVKALNIVSKAVSSRTTIPILKGILLNVSNDGILTMSASDLEISIQTSIEVENYEAGEIVLSAKLFSEIIRKLPSTTVHINVEGENAFINCGSSDFNIVGFSSDDFPRISIDEEISDKITFESNTLKDMIRKTSFAASIDEARGVLTGVLLECKENTINMVALDGFRMAVIRENIINGKTENIVIPAKSINEIGKIIAESEEVESVDVSIDEKRAVFNVGGTLVTLRLLEGNFVDYNSILKSDSKLSVLVNKNDLMSCVERASLFAKVGKNNLIKMEIKDSLMEITSQSEEGNVKEEVIITKEGENLTIGFNSKYMIDCLRAIDDEEIKMYFNTPISPCLVRPVDGNEYEYLILPVRITNN